MVTFQWDSPCNIWTHGWKVMGFLRFQPKLGMLSTIVNARIFAQTCPNLPKDISLEELWNATKIWGFHIFKIKKDLHIAKALKHVLTFWIFKKIILICLFYCQKTDFVCEFQHIPLLKMIFFSMFHTSYEYEILWTCT
jgi:hypothetical protein